MSLCAKCGSVMGERTHHEMPIEVCPECQGQWMDHMTLEHILNKLAADQLVESLRFGALAEFMNRVESVETDYPCPACKRTTLVSHSHQGIEIDWCPTCHGVFLDCNEIGLLAAWRRSKSPDSYSHHGLDTGHGSCGFCRSSFASSAPWHDLDGAGFLFQSWRGIHRATHRKARHIERKFFVAAVVVVIALAFVTALLIPTPAGVALLDDSTCWPSTRSTEALSRSTC